MNYSKAELRHKHGQRITCKIYEQFIDDAKISVNADGSVYIVHNVAEGKLMYGGKPKDMLGYTVGWYFDTAVTNIQLSGESNEMAKTYTVQLNFENADPAVTGTPAEDEVVASAKIHKAEIANPDKPCDPKKLRTRITFTPVGTGARPFTVSLEAIKQLSELARQASPSGE